MLPAVLLAAIPLLGTTANGLQCSFDSRCVRGVCLGVSEAPMRVVFVRTPTSTKPTVFVLGDQRLFEGRDIGPAEVPAMSSVFGDFGFAPETFTYAVGRIDAYDPAQGTLGLEVGGHHLTVAAEGTAEVVSLREGRPGVSWFTRYTGTCTARTY